MPVSIDATESRPLIIHPNALRPSLSNDQTTTVNIARQQVRRFLTSKTGHYAILVLVSLDVSCIFADFILSLYMCEHTCKGKPLEDMSALGASHRGLDRIQTTQDVLGIISLLFSCLFMMELLGSIVAFGPSFFRSKFHCFDALIIIAGFILDVCLKGVLEEIGSIVVVLRLWRVVKIIEELSAGAEEQMEGMAEKLESAERERDEAVKEARELRRSTTGAKVDGNGNGNGTLGD